MKKAYQLISQYKFIAELLVASSIQSEVNKKLCMYSVLFHTFCDKAAGAKQHPDICGWCECENGSTDEGDNNYSMYVNHLPDNK